MSKAELLLLSVDILISLGRCESHIFLIKQN